MDNADCADGILVKWWDRSDKKHEKKVLMKKKSSRSYLVSGLREDTEYTIEVCVDGLTSPAVTKVARSPPWR